MNRFLFISLLLRSLFSPKSLEVLFVLSSTHTLSLSLSPCLVIEFDFCGHYFSGSESVVYEAILDGRRVAAKKPILSTSDDLDKFHRHLQLLWSLSFVPFEKVYKFCTMLIFSYLCFCIGESNLDHPGVAKLLAAHAKPPNYVFFFEFYESGTLAEKLHVEEWSPSIDQVLMITLQLGMASLLVSRNVLFVCVCV